MLTVTVCSSVFFRGLKPHLVISVMLGVSTTNEPILVLILQPVACSMREVTVQNLRAQACKEQQQTEKRQEQTSPTLTSKQKIKQQTARETATMMSVETSSSATARRWCARRPMHTQTSQSQRQIESSNNHVTIEQRCERGRQGRRGRRGERGERVWHGAAQRVSDRVKEATYGSLTLHVVVHALFTKTSSSSSHAAPQAPPHLRSCPAPAPPRTSAAPLLPWPHR
jgi:hypothetical protein